MGTLRAVVAFFSMVTALLVPAWALAAAPLQVSAAPASVAPHQKVTFIASGGSGDYRFAVRSNASGSSISVLSGNYTAGATPNVTDIIEVTDTDGANAVAFVNVGPGVKVLPESAQTLTFGSVSFAAEGGSGNGFTWRLVGNSSGGRVDAATGQYTAGGAANVVDCVEVTDSLGNTGSANISVGARLTLVVPSTATPPRGSITFSATGGTTPYGWKLLQSGSGGTIDPTTGVYRAGAIPNVIDRVQVADAVGATMEASIFVGAPVTVSPQSVSLVAGSTLAFSVVGGSGTGYVWAVQTSTTGGTVSNAGIYVAGSTRGTDVVTVKDSLGNTATAQVTVLPVASAGFGSDVEQIPVSSIADITSLEGGGGCSLARRTGVRSGSGVGLAVALGLALALARRRAARQRRAGLASRP